MTTDLDALAGQPVIVGAGLAGLMTALRCAPRPVVVVSRYALGTDAASAWAQGGLAASLGDDDSAALHLADTVAAGDGATDAETAARIVAEAPAAISTLAQLGARFDRDTEGRLRLGLEAAHSRRRIVHAAGDGTGRELMRALVEVVRRTPSITVLEGMEARRLLIEDNRVAGVLLAATAANSGDTGQVATGRLVLATGGIGGLYADSTNPPGCFGQGLALAARAGAVLTDLEFVQFHPTALAGQARPMPLISEAVRGDGAVLVDETGQRFLVDLPGTELATRDAVARAVWRHLNQGHRVFIDARAAIGARFADRFPAIAAACRAAGIEPATDPIPVRPAAHYHMGGVAVEAAGRTSVTGLWACGEVARTGLHGANRLASNSLIEAVVCAGWVAASLADAPAIGPRTKHFLSAPPTPDPGPVRPIMSRDVGIERDADGLRRAITELLPLAEGAGPAADPALAGLLVALAAWRRRESRGAHYRTDFPARTDTAEAASLTLDDALAAARELDPPALPRLRTAQR